MRAIGAALGFVIFSLGSSFAADAPATAPAKSATPPSASSDAAAARHAKRIACRKEARDRKLIGDEKIEYIKECIKKPAAAKP
jgi:hypothetical protein